MLPLEYILIVNSSLPSSAYLSLGSEWLTQLKYLKGLGPTVFSVGQKSVKRVKIIKPRIVTSYKRKGRHM